MSRIMLRRKSSMRSVLKSLPIAKEPSTQTTVVFQWSISAAQLALAQERSSSNFHPTDLESSEQTLFFSSPSPIARNSSTSNVSFSGKKLSPRLPHVSPVHHNQGNNEQSSPLSLSYSQLHNAQDSFQTKKNSRTRLSIYPASNTHLKSISVVKRDTPSSSLPLISNRSPRDTYKRLQSFQLRGLHVSEKYIKEAKTLYFNANSRVFVPRLPTVAAS